MLNVCSANSLYPVVNVRSLSHSPSSSPFRTTHPERELESFFLLWIKPLWRKTKVRFHDHVSVCETYSAKKYNRRVLKRHYLM